MDNSFKEMIMARMQFGGAFIVFSILLISLSLMNYKLSKEGYSENNYENISDKIRHAQIEYYKAGKSYRRKIVVFLQKRYDLVLEFRGYAKNMVDERYFLNKQNWEANMVYTVKKGGCCLKQVEGLIVNGKPIFISKRKFNYYNGNALEKSVVEAIIGVVFLYCGIYILSKYWKYLKK